MHTEQIVALLVAERDRLSRAIEALQGPTKRRGRPPKSGNTTVLTAAVHGVKTPAVKRGLSAAGRKAIADAARRRWAAIKAGKAPSPFATGKRKK